MFHNTKKKQIILVRHAKCVDDAEFGGLDFDRPLSPHGEASLSIVARYLRLIGVKPERIFASPAKRTLETAATIASQYPWVQVEYVKDLYNGGSAGKRDADAIYLSLVAKMKRDATLLMIVGHNDDLTNFARYLSGDGVPSMKKWSVIVLSVPDEIEWRDVKRNTLSLVYYLTPQFLRLEELV